jgi:lactoylglutathione lyase
VPAERAFPVVFARRVVDVARFYEALGFERHFELPEEGEPGYVGLRRGAHELAVVSAEWPAEQYGLAVGDGPRFEMFVYVDDLDAVLAAVGAPVLRAAETMPWGERVAYVADPEGNPVALAQAGTPA